MMKKMLERLSVDRIYASPMSNADEPFRCRDLTYDDTVLKELKKVEGIKVEGTTQGNTLIVIV